MNGERAPRIRLTETQLSEPREPVPMIPAVRRMVERFAKAKGISISEAAEKMILIAVGRLGALQRNTFKEDEES